MKTGDKVGIVCCSNGRKAKSKAEIEKLQKALESLGLAPVFSDTIYEKTAPGESNAKERAEALMQFYMDSSIKAIFDISGGDIANEILPYLGMKQISQYNKMFWGYSDLTTIINALYTCRSRMSVLYQVRNLISEHAEIQMDEFKKYVFQEKEDLFQFPYEFIQGESMEGVLVGGNIRCFLKLAGTKYFPDMTGKILFLEAYSGDESKMITYFSQLQQIGAFDKVKGVILGTFTELEEKGKVSAEQLLMRFVHPKLPVVTTKAIGHGTDSKALMIGAYYKLD